MQVLIGRVTADAKVTTLTDERQVTNFSIAINDSYKTKEGGPVKLTTFINCSYWVNPAVASYLKKGTLVELTGRLGVNAYNDLKGEAKATITLHVNNIKLHGGTKMETSQSAPQAIGKKNRIAKTAEEITEPIDDLPF
jgi:single-strand DNA-binding protein